MIYEVWVAKSAFGNKGFGDALVEYVHASPSKIDTHTLYVHSEECPDDSWDDDDTDTDDGGETGGGVTGGDDGDDTSGNTDTNVYGVDGSELSGNTGVEGDKIFAGDAFGDNGDVTGNGGDDLSSGSCGCTTIAAKVSGMTTLLSLLVVLFA